MTSTSAPAEDDAERISPYFTNQRAEMLAFVPESAARVLEVGCGAGVFGAALKRRAQVEVTGIELSAEAAEKARGVLDRVLTGNVERDALDLPANYFDCIVCNDVLEHLVDPWGTLAKLATLLAPGGCIVASLPNIRFHKVVRKLVWPGEWRYTDSGILDRTHLRFFTRATAIELFTGAGLALERIEGLHRARLPAWLRLINSLSGGRFSDMEFLQYALVGRRGG